MKSPSRPPLFALFFVLMLAAGSTASAQSSGAQSSDTTAAERPALRRTLLAMQEADQAVRQQLIQKQKAGEEITLQDVARIDSVDRAHRERLKVIIEEHGWPGRSLVGEDGAGAAFLIAQHADRDTAFQRRALEHVRRAHEAGEVSGQDLALLTDRVLVNADQPQRYGTQTSLKDGAVVLQPLEDSTNVDRRREEIGLMPLEEYLRKVEEMYLPQSSDGVPDDQ